MTSILPRNSFVPDVFRLLETLPLVDRHIMRVEDYLDADTYVIRAEMPGMDPAKDIEVTIDGDVLTITGQRTEGRKTHGRSEFHYGTYARSITLPRGADGDKVEATYTAGVLQLTVPMTSSPKAKQIPIANGAEDPR
ncbi:Hsp20/alpha crystallin family protein [Actinokineospora bangkokensis]|uniref:SHSP domain-containing protein n=1 Tax=Actinokineospora bangkokensis TaxID=1193682 RepID=A0A1Q9LQZ6_9PSEU|nr:Hsp20/alpha crystallin family protein [Actinokineospora bangkokensis]OLR94477.1 hypothetical protein BJP25_12065 [Actinokineospora bangkokensis]